MTTRTRHSNAMLNRFKTEFPAFHARLSERDSAEIEQVLPPATDAEIAETWLGEFLDYREFADEDEE